MVSNAPRCARRGSSLARFGLAVAAVMLASLPLSAAAELHPNDHQGWVIGLGVGGGSAETKVGSNSSDRKGGASGNFRVGYCFDPAFMLGLESTGLTRKENGVTTSMSLVGAALTWYAPGTGFYARAGAGASSLDASSSQDVGSATLTTSASQSGWGALAGIGYELRMTRRFAIGPAVDFAYGDVGDDITFNQVSGLLQANWYFLPKQ